MERRQPLSEGYLLAMKLNAVDDYSPLVEEVDGPTHHGPGSPEKIAVMAARVAKGKPTFLPSDGK